MMEVTSIGDKLTPGKYRFHSRFGRAVNFRCNDSLAAIVDEGIGAGPLNVVVRGLDPDAIRFLSIGSSGLYLDGHKICYDGHVCFMSEIRIRGEIEICRFLANLSAFETYLVAFSSLKSLAFLLDAGRKMVFTTPSDQEFVKRIESGVDAIRHRNYVEGVRMMKGLGFGLTPSGDDFIAGMLSAMDLLGLLSGRDDEIPMEQIYRSATGENLLSNAFLYCARNGWFSEKQKALVEAILCSGKVEIFERTSDLLGIGETSGADWGTGFAMTLRNGWIRA